ncbi:MAG: hypothetical protein K2H09_08175 [Treponemataceae bacterium]|nr:hypothetical protein [Treponemataceae bacterium]
MEQFATSPAAQVIIAIVPIVGIFVGGVTVFFYLLWRHHEIKLQLKTGVFVQRKFDLKSFSLLAGLLLSGVGLTLALVFLLISGFSYALLGGLIPAVLGIGLLVFYKINPDFRAGTAGGSGK